ncbi:MAG: nicotinate-nucleotide adenylyltransferase [Syntrophobacteraceae bacterium]
MTELGVIHGRFQVLHNDHLKYLMAGKERCSHMVVGITNPDPVLTKDDPTDPQRSSPAANPLTYFERHSLMTAALLEAGLGHSEFSVVPFPINFPELYRFYVPLEAVYYLTIYDEWGKHKQEIFQALGLEIEVLWTRPIEQKGLRARDVRKKMALGEEWRTLVPASAAELMARWKIPERLRALYEKDLRL